MRTLRTERMVLDPVDGKNARDLWGVLNSPDLRKYQDIPRVRVEEFERQVRARPKALRPNAAGRFEWLLRAGTPLVPVGWISLRVGDRSPRVGEVGPAAPQIDHRTAVKTDRHRRPGLAMPGEIAGKSLSDSGKSGVAIALDRRPLCNVHGDRHE